MGERLHDAALITIDTQRDVLDEGAFPIPGTSAALPAMRAALDAFRQAQRPIVHVVRIYERDGSNAEPSRRQLLASGFELLARGSEGVQLASELLPEPELRLDEELLLAGGVQELGPGEVALFKPRWGAFYKTALERHLNELAVSTIVFTGCNFPNCPRTSIYEASERDYDVIVVRDAVSGLYERGERELEGIGVRLMTAAVLTEALTASAVT